MKSKAFSFGLLVSASAATYGAQLTGELYSDIKFTTNASKSAAEGENDTIQTTGVFFGLNEDQKSFQTNLNLRLEKEFYYENSLEGRTTLTTGAGLLNFGVVESFLDWKSSVTRSELLNDPLAEDLPDNRGFRTVYRTGPVVSYNISKATKANLDLQYQAVENSNSEVSDSERATANLSLLHLYNSLTTLTAAAGGTDVFENDELAGFKRANFNVGVARQINRGEVTLKYGGTRIDPDDGESSSTSFYELSLDRSDVWTHDLKIRATRNTSDSSIGFNVDEAGVDNDSAILRGVAVNDIIVRERYTSSINKEGQLYSYIINLSWEHEDYDVQLADERTKTAGLTISQKVSEDFTSGYSYNYVERNFVDEPEVGKDKIQTIRSDLRYVFNRDMKLTGYVQYTTRDNVIDPSRDYEDWSVGASFSWTFLK